MRIHIDPRTAEALRSKRPEPGAALRLAAINEGCGCGGDVWFEMNWDLPRPDDIRVETEGAALLVDPHSREFFDTELILAYTPGKEAFSLKSRNQIYLHNIHL